MGLAEIPVKFHAAMGRFFTRIAKLNARYPCVVILCVLSLSLLALGFLTVRIESDLGKLWVEENSRLHAENDFTDDYFSETATRTGECFGICLLRCAALRWLYCCCACPCGLHSTCPSAPRERAPDLDVRRNASDAGLHQST